MDEVIEMGEMLDGVDNSCATAGGGDVASARERRTPAIASVTWTSVALPASTSQRLFPCLRAVFEGLDMHVWSGGGRTAGSCRVHVLLLSVWGGFAAM
jgi:hypothetical protein